MAAARQGRTVVRLKGGDPTIFARLGEELAALKAAGIPFEIVPGVTAALAAGSFAGICLTHRDEASAVAFVTGHEQAGKQATGLDFAALARFPGTLVFYMGVTTARQWSDALYRGRQIGHHSGGDRTSLLVAGPTGDPDDAGPRGGWIRGPPTPAAGSRRDRRSRRPECCQ